MDAGSALRNARRRAALTQRDLARLTGIAQPAIARIERGAVVPRVDTLARLLRACGKELEVEERIGVGVDRSVMRELLKLSPRQRLVLAADEANNLAPLLGVLKK